MKKTFEIAFIILSFFILSCIITGCFKIAYLSGNNKDNEWMQKWKRIIVLDLKNENNVEQYFVNEYDNEWDFIPEEDPYKGYLIILDFDILYNVSMDNYIIIELSSDNEILFLSKINIF